MFRFLPKLKPLEENRFTRHQATIHITDNKAVLGSLRVRAT